MSQLSSEAIRKELLRRKGSFGDKISKNGRSKDVCLIEINWFKVLMYFLSKSGVEKPPPIPNQTLFIGTFLRKDIQYKVDFDISDEETFDFFQDEGDKAGEDKSQEPKKATKKAASEPKTKQSSKKKAVEASSADATEEEKPAPKKRAASTKKSSTKKKADVAEGE